jgi:hypothetical protein
MACEGKPTSELAHLADYTDDIILWIIEQHTDPEWLSKEQPAKRPKLRRYMRLTQQEARRRGLLGT